MNGNKQYFAFISYKREDEKWAKWLQNKLEHYKLPSNLNGITDLPQEIRPIFRDQSELAGGVLADEINKALVNSKYLIVICSPRAAQSQWVGKEVQTFIDWGRTDRIIPFIIGGVAHARNSKEECFPLALLNLPPEQELLGINIDEMGRDAAAVKVIAQMFGLKFDTLWQRYERDLRRKKRLVSSGVLLFALLALGVAGWIWHQNVKLKEKDWKMMENQSKFVAEKAKAIIKDDSYLAKLLAIEILPKNMDCPNRPYTPEAESLLRESDSYDNAVLRGHIDGVLSASFSSDGKRIVSSSLDKTVRVWNAETGALLKVLKGHKDIVRYACFSPDDGLIASASYDGTICLWDVETGDLLRTMNCHGAVMSICFSIDGKQIVSGSYFGGLSVWDVNTGDLLRTIECNNCPGFPLIISSDGKHIVSAINTGTICAWNIETGLMEKTMEGHASTVFSVNFSSEGKRFLSASIDKTIRIWDAETGNLLKTIEGHKDAVNCVAFSPDDKLIVSASEDGTIRIWDAETGKPLKTMEGHTSGVNSVAFSPNGSHVVSSSWDGTVRIWRVDIYWDEIVRIWRVGQESRVFRGHVDEIRSAVYNPNANRIVSASYDGTIDIWDAETGKLLNSIEGCGQPFMNAVFSPDGTKIASASFDGKICVWDAETGKLLKTMDESGIVWSVGYSPDGKQIVSVSGGIHIWSVEGDLVKSLTDKRALYAAFSPDGEKIISTSEDRRARVWDVEKGELLNTLEGHTGAVFCASFSPDGKHVATASEDKTVRIWDVETGELLGILEGHTFEVMSVAFSPDGKLVASAGGTPIVWDVKTGVPLKAFNSYYYVPNSVAFSPDNSHIVVATDQGVIIVLDFPPLQKLIDQTHDRFKERPLTPEERRQYYLE